MYSENIQVHHHTMYSTIDALQSPLTTIRTGVLSCTTSTHGALARLPTRAAVRYNDPFEGAVDMFASSSPRGLPAAAASVFPAHDGFVFVYYALIFL